MILSSFRSKAKKVNKRPGAGIVATLAIVNSVLLADEIQGDGIRVPAFDLSFSNLLSAETRTVLKQRKRGKIKDLCPFSDDSFNDAKAILVLRQCYDKHYYADFVERQRERYQVVIEARVMAGVATEIITPAEGVPVANQNRVLINLHGGALLIGARWGGQVESIPIAARGKFKVVSVDYRMGPEYKFPAASEDVALVYQELLKTYPPENIGIYGCSGGGLLAAQSVAWIARQSLPRPGAVGIFCSGAGYWTDGDSGPIVGAIMQRDWAAPDEVAYFHGVSLDDPYLFPAYHDHLLKNFPPSLLINSVRDQTLSSAAHTHSRLTALGVPAELHVWEGLGHAFFYEPDLPESGESYDVMVRFFDRYLGRD